MMMTMAELAAELHVDRRQIHAWYKRRARNGFPEPIAKRPIGTEGRERLLWDIGQVSAWRKTYTPGMGGRPKGSAKKSEETC